MSEVHQDLASKPVRTAQAAARAGNDKQGAAQGDRESGTKRKKGGGRALLRNALIAVIIVGLACGAMEIERKSHSSHSAPTAASKTLAQVHASAKSSASPAMAVSASPSASDTGSSTSSDVQQIPLATLFPQTVRGTGTTVYTLVQSGQLPTCTAVGAVGTSLAGMLVQSSGCIGAEGALYKDAANDQFSAVIFTLKDPDDVVSILSALASDVADFEVAPIAPPKGSGLANLSATSGIIQSFASGGNYLGVFMAQWATGEVGNYNTLQGLLTPVQNAVSTGFDPKSPDTAAKPSNVSSSGD